MTNIINKNLRRTRRERAERAGDWIAGALMLIVAAGVFGLAMVSAFAPELIVDVPQ